MREHADEHASLGSTSNGELSNRWYGLTPANNPGAVTIRTNELVTLLSRHRSLLIDMAFSSCGRSLPNAIGLQGLGHGEAFSEGLQARLSRKIRELTDGDRSAPIVVYCANSERLTSYHMVRRLVELGYTQVHWYRGGWEAWLMAGLPTLKLSLHSW